MKPDEEEALLARTLATKAPHQWRVLASSVAKYLRRHNAAYVDETSGEIVISDRDITAKFAPFLVEEGVAKPSEESETTGPPSQKAVLEALGWKEPPTVAMYGDEHARTHDRLKSMFGDRNPWTE